MPPVGWHRGGQPGTRQAALDALNNSPLRNSPNWSLTTWETREARATHLRLFAREVPSGTYRVQGGAYLRLAGPTLSMLVGFRWTDGAGFGDAMRMEHFYHALLGAMITVSSTCGGTHVADRHAEERLSPVTPLKLEHSFRQRELTGFDRAPGPSGKQVSRGSRDVIHDHHIFSAAGRWCRVAPDWRSSLLRSLAGAKIGTSGYRGPGSAKPIACDAREAS